ncbi:MAG: hypothetical protein F6K28_60120 [Microcoleus sp. SIO2G3]|nr:hypothetical protein [Microcoleus sp. SIO2G3]
MTSVQKSNRNPIELKHFAIVTNSSKVSKFDNRKDFGKREKILKRKQQKLPRKTKESKRYKYTKIVAKVYEWMRFIHP